jgi:NAD(P)-dependent dehydrogenase (short-subunit alcohol dehydrogenase family)
MGLRPNRYRALEPDFSASNRPTDGAENPEHHADYEQDSADRVKDRDAREIADEQQDYAEDDHCVSDLSWKTVLPLIRIAVSVKSKPELDSAVSELGERAIGVKGDVANPEDLDRLYATVADSGRRIDVLFANAAVIDVARIGDLTEKHLDYLLDVDFKGLVFTVQKALPLLTDGASVILNSSNVANRGSDGIGVYAAIKAAVRSLARTWASELRERKIRVNVVSPGATATPGIETLANLVFTGPTAVDQFTELQKNTVPLARLAEADEVAKAVVFLASDLSSFTTGADVPVDGGINQI